MVSVHSWREWWSLVSLIVSVVKGNVSFFRNINCHRIIEVGTGIHFNQQWQISISHIYVLAGERV